MMVFCEEEPNDRNDPCNLGEGMFEVDLAYYHTFGNFLASYELILEEMWQRLATGKVTLNAAAVPLMFLMRHGLELGYKYTLTFLYDLNEEIMDEKLMTHDLVELHRMLDVQYQRAVGKYGLSPDEQQDFQRHYAKTGKWMNKISKVDPLSFHFRYPVDKKSRPVFNIGSSVNLLSMKNGYDEAMLLLNHTPDVLENCRDIRDYEG